MPDAQASLEALTRTVAELKEQVQRRQGGWDRLATLSTFLSTVVLGTAGLWFTHSYNVHQTELAERQGAADAENKRHQARILEAQASAEAESKRQQSRILEMQAVERFIPYLTRDDEKAKEVALLVITTLGSTEFATQFARLNPSKGTQAAADRIMANAAGGRVAAAPAAAAGPAPAPSPPPAPGTSPAPALSPAPGPSPAPGDGGGAFGGSAPPARAPLGWVYLGHFDGAARRWESRYFDFEATADPASLVQKRLSVSARTGAVNVRSDMPSPEGVFPGVRRALQPPAQVTVRTVREWSSTGYMWAEVEP